MNVLLVAAEADPLVKIGGLGDVAPSLPKELLKLYATDDRAIDIRLVIPFHSVIRNKLSALEHVVTFEVAYLNTVKQIDVHQTHLDNLTVYLVEADWISSSGSVYSDNVDWDTKKYTLFCVAVAQMIRQIDWHPDILHVNDWHTALVPMIARYLAEIDPSYKLPKSLLTIHNLPFMGANAGDYLWDFHIPFRTDHLLPGWADSLPLSLGLAFSDRISFVSNGYAQEVLTSEFGCGLEWYLRQKRHLISGIVNGIDTDQWDPAHDPEILRPYSIQTLSDKAKNKEALLNEAHLDASSIEKPLLAIIGRLDYQKGMDIAIAALMRALDMPWSIVILGTGNSQIERDISHASEAHPDRIATYFRFDSALAHRIYAGADLLLMPSRYEPCGLAQMIAMRYGTLVLARSVGGLRDTITPEGTGKTGYLFQEANPVAMEHALRKALGDFASRPDYWRHLQSNAMSTDFSWTAPARQYYALYQELLSNND